MGKAFTTAVKQAADGASEEPIKFPHDFTLDGRKIHYRDPKDGEALMMSTISGRHVNKFEQLGGVIDLFAAVLAPKDRDHIISRLLDPNDDFGSEQLFGTNGEDGIIADMIETWSGRPTLPSSDS